MTNLRATFELHEACAGVLRRPRRINPPSATPPQPIERRARAPADLRALARPYMPHFSRATCRRIPRSSRELADRLPLTPAPLAQLAHASRMYGLHIFLAKRQRVPEGTGHCPQSDAPLAGLGTDSESFGRDWTGTGDRVLSESSGLGSGRSNTSRR